MTDEKTSESTPAASQTPPKAKKEKPPAVEDKPFTEFIQQDFLPTLETALKDKGVNDVELKLDKQPLNLFGTRDPEAYWQVKGAWQQGARQFNIAFTKEDITSPKVFYLADRGAKPSTLEQFMGDERKITLDLMVMYTLQRLNGQKWLTRN
ncbi:MAG: DUF2996 domain-containing protein [Leptolyngbyaceae cyanobacterium SM2_3_12]|nr:DUF2996 domain-containing protein [Leptolyngbyaceae cyanobacterium SM2_3_12]